MDLRLMWCVALTATITLAQRSVPGIGCTSNTCGENANCEMVNGRARCKCPEGHVGNPLYRCTPECTKDSDCSNTKLCEKFRCRNVCDRGACVPGAQCSVENHRPVCKCPPGFVGSPERLCVPECTEHSHCPSDKMCMYPRCVDPCEKACGENAECEVRNHMAICSCPRGMTGNSLERCRPLTPEDVCKPNRCGKNAKCTPEKDEEGYPVAMCTCPPGFYGKPLVECEKGNCVNSDDCPANMVCQRAQCKNPCENSGCGIDAICEVRSHRVYCRCKEGYAGNPLSKCSPVRLG